MKKKLIINADDYGMNEGTVDGIIQCSQAKAITSTTFMTTGGAFSYAIANIEKLGSISIGIHLNATDGKPISLPSEVPSLVSDSGAFKVLRDPHTVESIRPLELKMEFRRQIERGISHNLKISHLDNHHNWIYFSPRHFQVVAELAHEFALPVRFPFGSLTHERINQWSHLIQGRSESIWNAARSCQQILDQYQIPRVDSFWMEFTVMDRSRKGLLDLVEQLPPGISEICVHPGMNTDRQKMELEILIDIGNQRLLQANADLELVNYWALKK